MSTPTYLTLITDLAPMGETGTELAVFQGIMNFNYVLANLLSGYLWEIGGLTLETHVVLVDSNVLRSA